MTSELDISAIEEISQKLQEIDPVALSGQPQQLYETAIWCATQKAFTGEQMAVAKKHWNEAKKKAYEKFIFNAKANQEYIDHYGTAIIKDYIASCAGELEAIFVLIERTNNALGYMEDACRTVISAIKEELKSNQYSRSGGLH